MAIKKEKRTPDNISDEEKKEIIQNFKGQLNDMTEDTAYVTSKLGNTRGANKLHLMYEIMASLTDEEIVEIGILLEDRFDDLTEIKGI